VNTISPTLEITTGDLATDERLSVRLKRVAGESGLDRPIRHPRIQKSGLALAGHYYGVVPTRVQVLGGTELSYLDKLDPNARGAAARAYFALGLSCVVLTRDEPHKTLVAAAEATGTPLYVSDNRSSRTINALHALLDERLAPQTKLHGVLVDVFGIGVLLLGKSGIGKSECALDLIVRGHRLVADDTVEVRRRQESILIGTCPELTRYHMELRGLGVINIMELFGIASTRSSKRIELVVQLERWVPTREYERLGIDDVFYEILGLRVPLIRMPVAPGRNIAILVEVAARNQLLRARGHHAARALADRLDRSLRQASLPALEEDDEELEPGGAS